MNRKTGAIILFLVPIIIVLGWMSVEILAGGADASYAFELARPLVWSAVVLWPLAAFFWWRRNAPVGAAPTTARHWKIFGIVLAALIVVALVLRVLDQQFGIF